MAHGQVLPSHPSDIQAPAMCSREQDVIFVLMIYMLFFS